MHGEFVHYVLHGNCSRATVRGAHDIVPVTLNQHTVWTRYYVPRQFYLVFAAAFTLDH